MDFWSFLGYVLSLITEIFYITLFEVSLPDGTTANINFGSIIIFPILLAVIIHLLIPSARGV